MKKNVFLFFLTLLPLAANADMSGLCGENLTWTYVEATRTLTISGEGDMYDYDSNIKRAPWFHSYYNVLNVVIIEDGVTSIGDNAFCGCTSLTSVTIPESVTSIGYSAFSGCNNLPVVDNIRYADTYAVGVVDKELSTYVIKEGTKWIGENAFYECKNLASIVIPKSLISIGNKAFSGCSSLTSIDIPNLVTSIGDYTFYCCGSLASVTIGNSVTRIGDYAFTGCSSLTSVDFGTSVEYIGYGAFAGCDLQGICFPASLKEIGEHAFKAELKIDGQLTIYGGNKNISQVEIHAVRPPACTGKIFDDEIYRTVPLHVFTGSCEYYYSALGWNHFYTIYDDEIKYIQTDDGLKIVRQSPVFDLTGRKISNGGDTEGLKGIYIVDGKKVWFR